MKTPQFEPLIKGFLIGISLLNFANIWNHILSSIIDTKMWFHRMWFLWKLLNKVVPALLEYCRIFYAWLYIVRGYFPYFYVWLYIFRGLYHSQRLDSAGDHLRPAPRSHPLPRPGDVWSRSLAAGEQHGPASVLLRAILCWDEKLYWYVLRSWRTGLLKRLSGAGGLYQDRNFLQYYIYDLCRN